MRVRKHLKVNFHILNSGTSRCLVFFFNCAFLLFLPLSWLLTTTRRLSLRLTPPVSSPSFPLTSFPPPGLFSFFRSICSAVRRWVDFNELFDERLSLVRRRDGGGRMEEKHHLFFWFPFLGSLPSLLTSLPPPLLYIFMFLNPFLSSLCPHLTFPLLTSPHILHPLLFFPSFHLCLISPCLPAFPFLNFFQFFTFSHFSCFLFPVFFISFLTSTPFHSSFDHIYLNLHLPAVLMVPFLLSPAHLFLFFSFLLFSFFFHHPFLLCSSFCHFSAAFLLFFFCFCSHPFSF